MLEVCHRCQRELPDARALRGGVDGGPGSLDDAVLFCPHCGAPQVRLPEHLQIPPAVGPSMPTTGATPPPRPRPLDAVDWRVAIASAAAVAGVAALLTGLGLAVSAISFFGTLWVISASVIVLGIYAKYRPEAQITPRMGMRIGVVTGLLVIVALGVTLTASGVVARYLTHGMSSFDQELSQQFTLLQTQMADKLKVQEPDAATQARILGFLGSQEVRGGLAILYMFVLGTIILGLSAGGGAFAGLLQGRRRTPVARS